jgi:hypothetical protein
MLKSKPGRQPARSKRKDCPSTLKMEAVFSSGTSVNFYQTTGRHIIEDNTLSCTPLPQLLPPPSLSLQQYFNKFLMEIILMIGLLNKERKMKSG